MLNISRLCADLKSLRQDLLKGINECSERCLNQSVKWLSELNFTLSHIKLAPEDIPVYREDCGDEYATFLLARSYFNLKEYDRCSYTVRNCVKPKTRFLYFYSRYLAVEKKRIDNMTDSTCLPEPMENEPMKALYSQMKSEFYENKLDAYCSYVYAMVLKRLDIRSAAIEALTKAVHEEPMLWCAWYELGKVISEKTKSCINQLPDHWMKLFFLGHYHLEHLNSDDALLVYQNLCDVGFDRSTYITSQIAILHHNKRNLDVAMETFSTILECDPYRLDNLDVYSNILYVLEKKTELANLAQKAVEIDKYRLETCCIIGNYYSLRADHAKAILYFKRALKINPSFLSAWTLMGHEYMELKNFNAAIESYRHATEINDRDFRAWYGLGQSYEILKMASHSLYYYKKAQELKPNDSRMYIALGEAYDRLEKTENALKCFYKAYMVGDIEGSALIKLAKLYDKTKDIDNAAAVFTEYCIREQEKEGKIVPEQTEYYNALKYLANYYLNRGELDDAYTYAFKCMECDETKEPGKALLKAIAAKRLEQDPEPDRGTNIDHLSKADSSTMDISY